MFNKLYSCCFVENESKEDMKKRIEANKKISKMLEKYHNLKQKMHELYNLVETETDEKKRTTAWEELQVVRDETINFAVENNLAYSDPQEIVW